MKQKIMCIILVSFLLLNIGACITSIGKIETSNNKFEEAPLNDVRLEPIEGNEEKLLQIEQKRLTTFSSGLKGNCAVVIRQYLPPSGGVCMANTCQHAINNLRKRGYDNILYIDSPTLNKLENDMHEFIINNIGGQKKLFFYVFAHGAASRLDGYVQINPFQSLRDDQFASYINKVSSYYSICTVVMESCEVGSFTDDLSGYKRIIITSTDADGLSYGEYLGLAPFSEKIFSAYGNRNNLKEAWEIADSYICSQRSSYPGQNPQLEDNGNGYSVGTYENADILPMNDGHTININKWDGNLAEEKMKCLDIIKFSVFNKVLGFFLELKHILDL